MSSTAVAMVGPTSTPMIMTPSPSHFATRTPRRTVRSRANDRNRRMVSIAACSPCVAMYAVNPHRSRNANARSTGSIASATSRGSSRPRERGAVPIAPLSAVASSPRAGRPKRDGPKTVFVLAFVVLRAVVDPCPRDDLSSGSAVPARAAFPIVAFAHPLDVTPSGMTLGRPPTIGRISLVKVSRTLVDECKESLVRLRYSRSRPMLSRFGTPSRCSSRRRTARGRTTRSAPPGS